MKGSRFVRDANAVTMKMPASKVSRRLRQKAAISRTMRAIRKTNTKPEISVRRLLHANGFRYRLHCRKLPGSPDIVLPKYRAVVLVHGCFWHQHPGCRLAKQPRTRTTSWLPKLARNVERDARVVSALTALGWRALIVWECEVSNQRSLRTRLRRFLLGANKVS
jgi:DNA mismatch endonuclease (patch repair protein)